MTQKHNVILFGHKGSGKSFFGKRLAEELKCSFIDSDALIEQLYANETAENRSCKEIYNKIGEKKFRQLESRIVQELGNTHHTVIALGGGTILNPINYEAIKKLGVLVYLEVNKEIIKQRLSEIIPAYLDPHEFEHTFEKMYEERKIQYEKLSAIKILIDEKTNPQVIAELKRIYQNQYKL